MLFGRRAKGQRSRHPDHPFIPIIARTFFHAQRAQKKINRGKLKEQGILFDGIAMIQDSGEGGQPQNRARKGGQRVKGHLHGKKA